MSEAKGKFWEKKPDSPQKMYATKSNNNEKLDKQNTAKEMTQEDSFTKETDNPSEEPTTPNAVYNKFTDKNAWPVIFKPFIKFANVNQKIVENSHFNNFVIVCIIGAGVLVGIQTYPSFADPNKEEGMVEVSLWRASVAREGGTASITPSAAESQEQRKAKRSGKPSAAESQAQRKAKRSGKPIAAVGGGGLLPPSTTKVIPHLKNLKLC